MDILCILCINCIPASDQMICIVIWQHWLILLFPAASCNQQELTGRWENTASVLHVTMWLPRPAQLLFQTAPAWRAPELNTLQLFWVIQFPVFKVSSSYVFMLVMFRLASFHLQLYLPPIRKSPLHLTGLFATKSPLFSILLFFPASRLSCTSNKPLF